MKIYDSHTKNHFLILWNLPILAHKNNMQIKMSFFMKGWWLIHNKPFMFLWNSPMWVQSNDFHMKISSSKHFIIQGRHNFSKTEGVLQKRGEGGSWTLGMIRFSIFLGSNFRGNRQISQKTGGGGGRPLPPLFWRPCYTFCIEIWGIGKTFMIST